MSAAARRPPSEPPPPPCPELEALEALAALGGHLYEADGRWVALGPNGELGVSGVALGLPALERMLEGVLATVPVAPQAV